MTGRKRHPPIGVRSEALVGAKVVNEAKEDVTDAWSGRRREAQSEAGQSSSCVCRTIDRIEHHQKAARTFGASRDQPLLLGENVRVREFVMQNRDGSVLKQLIHAQRGISAVSTSADCAAGIVQAAQRCALCADNIAAEREPRGRRAM